MAKIGAVLIFAGPLSFWSRRDSVKEVAKFAVTRPDLLALSNRNLFEAVKTDAKVGLTFATVASDAAAGSEKRTRNQANARKAYDTVLRLRNGLRVAEAEMQELAVGLSELKSALEGLGELFP